MRGFLQELHREDTAVLFPFIALLAGTVTLHFTSRYAKSIPISVIILLEGFLFSYVLSQDNTDKFAVLKQSTDIWAQVNGELLLFIFLPALLFGDTMALDYHTFERCFLQCTFMATLGVLISVIFMAACAYYILPFQWPFSFCMVFGSILSATDTVAVITLLKDIGASKLLSMKVAGEAILNDGTAIIVFNLFWALYLSNKDNQMSITNELQNNEKIEPYGDTKRNVSTLFHIIVDCFRVGIGGPLIGIIVGIVAYYWMALATRRHSRDDVTIQLSITLCTAYISYFIGDHIFNVSGVLCTCSSALVLSKYVWPLLSSKVTHENVWKTIDNIGNTVLFFLAGVLTQRAHSDPVCGQNNNVDVINPCLNFQTNHLLLLVLFFMLSSFIRMVVMISMYPILQIVGPSFRLKDCVFIGWSGLRGAVGVVLSLYVLQSSPNILAGKQLMFMVSGLSVISHIVQGMTVGPVLKALHLINEDDDEFIKPPLSPSQSFANILPPPRHSEPSSRVSVLACIYAQARAHATHTFHEACRKEQCNPSEVSRYLSCMTQEPGKRYDQEEGGRYGDVESEGVGDSEEEADFNDDQRRLHRYSKLTSDEGYQMNQQQNDEVDDYTFFIDFKSPTREARQSDDMTDTSSADTSADCSDQPVQSDRLHRGYHLCSDLTDQKTTLRKIFYRLVRVGYWKMIKKGKLSRSSPATLLLLNSIKYALNSPEQYICDIQYIEDMLSTSFNSKWNNFIDNGLLKLGQWSTFCLELLYRRNFDSCETMLYICNSYERGHIKAQKLIRKFTPFGNVATSIVCFESEINVRKVRNMLASIHSDMTHLIKTIIVAHQILIKEFEYIQSLIDLGVLTYPTSKPLFKAIHRDLRVLRQVRKNKAKQLARLQISVDQSVNHPSRSAEERSDTLLNIAKHGTLKSKYGSTDFREYESRSLSRHDSPDMPPLKRSQSLPDLGSLRSVVKSDIGVVLNTSPTRDYCI